MRGTLCDGVCLLGKLGITPAYAGNTRFIGDKAILIKDHPRVCGEHLPFACRTFRQSGSPPRMRGTPSSLTHLRRRSGITPAYAGNTASCAARVYRPRDHPRVCGEHICAAVSTSSGIGSPPRMRGTQGAVDGLIERAGITPAYAGNTPSRRFCMPCKRDHPRVCGEHHNGETLPPMLKGSPPRMRGTRGCWCDGLARGGITPAYAGNTRLQRTTRMNGWDHPRVCGEHSSFMNNSQCVLGSPPHMRGTPRRHQHAPHAPGITPAYAGNTLCDGW